MNRRMFRPEPEIYDPVHALRLYWPAQRRRAKRAVAEAAA